MNTTKYLANLPVHSIKVCSPTRMEQHVWDVKRQANFVREYPQL